MNEIILNYVRHNLELLAMAHTQPETRRVNTYSMVMLVPVDYQNPQTMWNVLFSATWLDKLSERDTLIQLYKQIQNQNPFSGYSPKNGHSIYAFRPIHTKNLLVKSFHQSLRIYNGFDVAIYSGDADIPIGYVIDSQLLKNLYIGNTLTIDVKDEGLIKVQITNLTKESIIVTENNSFSERTPKQIRYVDILDIERHSSQKRQNLFAEHWV